MGDQFLRSLYWSHSSWQITEWLINYAGGFVRRGLSGEALLYISQILNIAANHLAILLSFAIYGALLFFLIKNAREIYSPATLISPLLMGAPAYQDFIVRKDVLILCILVISLKLAVRKDHEARTSIALAIICAAGVLIHEAYFFVAFPVITAALLRKTDLMPSGQISRPLFSTSLVGLAFISSFVTTVIFKGSPKIALAIHNSWGPLWIQIDKTNCCITQPSAAIDAIGWSTSKGVSLSFSLLSTFSDGIYVPLAWICIIIVCFWLMIGRSLLAHHEQLKHFAAIMLLQLVSLSPLFILGWDYGRWIFLWLVSSVLIYVVIPLSGSLAPTLFNRAADKLLTHRLFRIKPPFWFLLIFGVPVCCWSIVSQIRSAPIGYALAHFYRLGRMLLL